MYLVFISKKYYAFVFSGALTALALILLLFKGLELGIDFTGGAIIELEVVDKSVQISDFIIALRDNIPGWKDKIENTRGSIIGLYLQDFATGGVADIEKLLDGLVDCRVLKIDYVGPQIGEEIVRNTMYALLLGLAAMFFYTWVRFSLSHALGISLALVHDLIMSLGFYSVTRIEFDASAVAALLTILGYSINDSIVIFDRIRENLRFRSEKTADQIINLSINQTLSRTIMTSISTLLACLAIVLFGGPVLLGFGLALCFGIVFGTYSSMYVAAPLSSFFQK